MEGRLSPFRRLATSATADQVLVATQAFIASPICRHQSSFR